MSIQAKIISKLDHLCKYSFILAVFFMPFSKAALEIFTTTTIISWFLYRLSLGNFYGNNKTLFYLFCFYIIFSCISGLYSGYPVVAFKGAVKLLKFVQMSFILTQLVDDAKWLKMLLYAVLLSYTLVIADSFYQFFTGYDLVQALPSEKGSYQVRVTGPFISYGLLAAYLIAVMPVLATLISKQKKLIYRIVLIALFISSLYILYQTHSRGAWIAAVIAGSVFSFLTRQWWIQIALLLTVVAAIFFLPRRTLIHVDTQFKEQSIVERYYLWDRAINVVRARPFLGCGINCFTRNYVLYDKTKSWRVPGYPVHNGFLQIMAESGLIAFGLFSAILIMAAKSGWQVYRNYSGRTQLLAVGLLTGFIALLCQGFVDTTFHNQQSGFLLWLLIGLLISINHWSVSVDASK